MTLSHQFNLFRKKRNFKAEYKVDNPCACQKDQVVRFTKFPTFIDQGGKH